MTVSAPISKAERYLADYVRRRRRHAAARAAAWASLVGIGWAALACMADRLHPLAVPVRAALLIVDGAAVVAVVAGPALGLARRRFNPVAAAAALEQEHPAFDHRLVTVASPGGSPDLRAAVARDVGHLIDATGPARVPRQPLVTAWAAVGLALLVAAGLWRWPWLDGPDLIRRLLRPTAGLPAVTTTRLAVLPGSTAVTDGSPLTVVADVRPASGDARIHVSDDDGHTWAERPMAAAADHCTATLGPADHDLLYFVTAGDATSPRYAVRVRRVPAVVSFRFRFDFPPALHRPPATLTNTTGHIDAPAGTTVTVDVGRHGPAPGRHDHGRPRRGPDPADARPAGSPRHADGPRRRPADGGPDGRRRHARCGAAHGPGPRPPVGRVGRARLRRPGAGVPGRPGRHPAGQPRNSKVNSTSTAASSGSTFTPTAARTCRPASPNSSSSSSLAPFATCG